MSIDPKYVIIEGTFFEREIVDFPRYFRNLLLSDKNLSPIISAAKNFENGEEFEVEKGLLAGLPGPSFGFRFSEIIYFTRDSPINFAIIRTGKMTVRRKIHAQPFVAIYFVLPELKQDSGSIVFRNRYGGFVGSGGIIGLDIKGDDSRVQGLSEIRNDKDLLNGISLLLKPGIAFYKDFVGNERYEEIRFEVKKDPLRWISRSNVKYGMVEMGLSTALDEIRTSKVDYAKLCKTSFAIAFKIALYIRSM